MDSLIELSAVKMLSFREQFNISSKRKFNASVLDNTASNKILLDALHKVKIVHRDIKCANIFMSAEGRAKLGDLNVSKIAKQGVL